MRWVIVLGVVLVCALAGLWGYSAGYHLRVMGWRRCRGLAKQIEPPLAECKSLLDESEREVQDFAAQMERAAGGIAPPERLDEVFATLGRPNDSPDISSADQIERARAAVRTACEKAAAEAASTAQEPRDAMERAAEAWSRLESTLADGGCVRGSFRVGPAFEGFLSGEGLGGVFIRLPGRHEVGDTVSGLFVQCGALRLPALNSSGDRAKMPVYAQSADMARQSQTLDELETQVGRLRRQVESINQHVQSELDIEQKALNDELVHFEGVSRALSTTSTPSSRAVSRIALFMLTSRP
jgi:hypothetical protein